MGATGPGPAHPRDQALHVGDRGFRNDAVAEVEDVRAAAGRGEDVVDSAVQSLSAGDEGERVEVALRRRARRQGRQRARRVERPVERERVPDAVAGEPLEMPAAAADEDDRARLRPRGLQARHDPADRFERQALEQGRGQGGPKALEDLHRLGARVDLRDEVGRGGRDEALDERRHESRVAIGEHPRGRLVGRALAGDHVARHRPGRAAEPEKGGPRRQGVPQPVEGLEHRRQALERQGLGQAAEIRQRGHGIKARAVVLDDADLLAEGMRHDEDIREQDRSIEPDSGGSAAE